MPIRIHVSQLSDEELLAKLGVKRRAKPRELERPHQVALIKWVTTVRELYPVLKLLYAIPNGGDRNLRVARKLKAEGVLAGVADLCLPAARRGHHGLYLEMKSEEGVTTKEQKEFLCGVSAEGYCAVIAQGVDEARAVLEWYIGITEHEPPSVLKTNLICQSHISGRQRGPKRRSDQRENYVLLTGDGRRPAVPKQSKWPFAVILITPPASNLEELHHAG